MKYKRSHSVPWRIVEDKAVLVDVASSRVLVLNEAGTEIWSFLDQKRDMDQIVRHMSEVFDGDIERIRCDSVSFIEDMNKRGVLDVS